MRFYTFILFLVLIYPRFIQAQSDSLDILLELTANDDGLAERLQELRLNPVNINTTDAADLSLVPFLTGADIARLIAYKTAFGGFTNSDSLKHVLGPALYRQIRGFVTIGYQHKQGFSYIQKNYRGKAPVNSRYAGGPWYNYSKIIYRRGYRWAGGAIIQKDPGERNYIDHLNGALRFRGNHLKLILGDFYLNFGQGLLFSNLYGVRKSTLPTAVFRDRGVMAHMNLSSSENAGKFGLYANYSPSAYHILGFISTNLYDARLAGNDVRTLRTDGYHRTDTEISGARRITENSAALGLSSRWKNISGGILFARYRYTPGFNLHESEQDARKNYFAFHGSQLTVGSMMYAFQQGPYRFSGEAAFSSSGKPAFQQSLFYRFRRTQAGVKFWHINPGFQSPDGRMFDDADPFPSANQGFIASLRLRLFQHWGFTAYKIFRRNLWRDYFNRMPVQKNEWLTEISFHHKKTRLFLRYRRREGESFNQMNRLIFKRQDNLRLEIAYRYPNGPWLRSRLEKTFFSTMPENGFLFFQDMGYRLKGYAQLTGRIAFYKTTSFDSRIYEFENDIPGSFSNYPLYGEGRLIYLMISGRVGKYLHFYFKWRLNDHYGFKTNGHMVNSRDNTLRSGFVLQM